MEEKKLGFASALIFGLNAAIGAGIFSAPLALHQKAGSIGILSYLLATILILLIGLTFSRLLKIYPSSSFLYDLPNLWGGKFAGRLSLYLYSGGLVVALGLLGGIAGTILSTLFHIGTPKIWSIVLLSLAALGSQKGTAWLAWGQYILFMLTIIPMALIIGLGFLHGAKAQLIPIAPHGWMSVLWSLPIVIFGFFGFESVPALLTKIKNPEKNTNKAIIGTIVITGVLYALFITSIFFLLEPQNYLSPSLGNALVQKLPLYGWIIQIIDWAIIITIVGTLYSMFPAVATILKQAHQGLSRSFTAYLAPALAILITLTATNINLLFNLTAICIASAFALTASTLFFKPEKNSPKDRLLGLMSTASSLIIIGCAIVGLL